MKNRVAIIGAGVSGLTCAVVLSERGWRTTIFAEETGQHTTSAAAAAIWFPYDAEPADAVITRSLATYRALVELSRDPRSGVSLIELRSFSRRDEIQIPDWAIPIGARRLLSSSNQSPTAFRSGFALNVPLMDTTLYLDYLANRFVSAGGEIQGDVRFANLEEVSRDFEVIINCAGIGARILVPDPDVEAHRGQVAIVPRLNLTCAIVCDDPPLMYAIPRANDCVFGGTNELRDDRALDPAATSRIVAECSRVLGIASPRILAERVGLRPFRRSGICLRGARLSDDRTVIHNYGHGGSGFTLSWGCAEEVFAFVCEAES